MYVLRVDDEEFHTILAALRFYQEHGQGDPFNRSARIHDIATNNGTVMSSLDDDGIDQLCERLNTESQKDLTVPKTSGGMLTKAIARRFFADFNKAASGKRVSIFQVKNETPLFEVTALKLNLNFGSQHDAYQCLERVFAKLAKKLKPRSRGT